jgi:plastocyanin
MTLKQAVALTATLGLALLLAPAAPAGASGGAGCGGPVTDGRGTEVAIELFCFAPTVLYAEPGDTVTWTNRDYVRHNVGGANLAWGSFELFRRGRSISHSFPDSGVYSYVCSIHPGMVGTVVVGDPAPEGMTAGDGMLALSPAGAGQSEPVPWMVVAILAAIGGFLVGARVRRRARTLSPENPSRKA